MYEIASLHFLRKMSRLHWRFLIQNLESTISHFMNFEMDDLLHQYKYIAMKYCSSENKARLLYFCISVSWVRHMFFTSSYMFITYVITGTMGVDFHTYRSTLICQMRYLMCCPWISHQELCTTHWECPSWTFPTHVVESRMGQLELKYMYTVVRPWSWCDDLL